MTTFEQAFENAKACVGGGAITTEEEDTILINGLLQTIIPGLSIGGTSISIANTERIVSYVEAMPRFSFNGTEMYGPSYAEVLRHMRNGDKISAIKLVRYVTGLGLKEAKDWVEAIPEELYHNDNRTEKRLAQYINRLEGGGLLTSEEDFDFITILLADELFRKELLNTVSPIGVIAEYVRCEKALHAEQYDVLLTCYENSRLTPEQKRYKEIKAKIRELELELAQIVSSAK